MPNNLVHWELMVSDPEKSKVFYGSIFDWRFGDQEMPGYMMIDAGAMPAGGMMQKPREAPGYALNSYFLVDNVDETMGKVSAAGGSVIVPKIEIPNVGWWGMFLDPDGIPIGVFQSSEQMPES